MRAIEVLPVPRGPAKRYAWRTASVPIALLSVRTTASCPTTSAKLWGRYFRYSAATKRFKQIAPNLFAAATDLRGRGTRPPREARPAPAKREIRARPTAHLEG